MIQILALVAPLFGLILLGYLSGRWRSLPVEGLAWLNFLVLYLAVPALIFQLLAKTPVHEFANAPFLLRTTLCTFAVFLLCFTLARVLRRGDVRVATIQGFSGAYGNIGYMGPPLAIAAFGPEAGVPVALIFCLDNAMHFTMAPLLMAMGGERRDGLLGIFATIVKRIVTHPFMLATALGILAATFKLQLPGSLNTLIDSLSTAAAPCALFAMGVTAALRPLKRVPADLGYLVPIKLLVHPALMYLLVSQVPDVDAVWVHTAVLMAALPTAANVFVIAQQYKIWEERASSAIVISTTLSIVTVTLFLYLVQVGKL